LSTVSDLNCVVIRKRHSKAERQWVLLHQFACILAGSLHFDVYVTWQSHQGLHQKQQINFAEGTVLTRFISTVIIIFEKFGVCCFESYGKLFIFKILDSGTAFQNTGFLPTSTKLAIKYWSGRWNTGHLATLALYIIAQWSFWELLGQCSRPMYSSTFFWKMIRITEDAQNI